jgi:hypothetical protein
MTMNARGATLVTLGSLGLLIAGTAVGPAPAAETLPAIGSLSTPVQVKGSVQVEFTASSATGCTDLCDVNGSLSWEPTGDAQLEVTSAGPPGRRRLKGLLVFFGGLGEKGPTTISHVVRRRSDGSTGVCSDARSSDLFLLDFSARSESQLEARLARGQPDDPDLFRTRCGGPLESDLVAALPSASLDRATLLKGRTTVDLSGTKPFAAAGLSGTVRSSLALHLGRPRHEPPITPLATPPNLPSRSLRTVTASYAIEQVAGSLTTAFRSIGERSVCEPLDVCGASGSVRLAPLASTGKATFVAYGSARRVSGRRLRAALGLRPGRRPRGVTALGSAEWTRDAGQAAESFIDGLGRSCRDSVRLGEGFMTFWVGRRRVFADYGRVGDSGLDPFRTRCPGPSLIDAAQDHPLAAGNVARAAFRKRRVEITLDRGRSFESEPYEGETRPALTITLRRLEVRERVDVVPNGIL